jgi:cytochrome b subunit of formate dehydrogenase
MFYIGDLFQWERFITPSIIKLFYWLVVIMVLLAGLSGLAAAAGAFFVNPITGALAAIASFAGMLVGILFARIAAEFILMVFRINEHLAAIRNRGGM